jgi:urea transport system ATP-binding protein
MGLAILLVEQYLDFARELADTIAIMDRGRIVVAGPPSELDKESARRYLTV